MTKRRHILFEKIGMAYMPTSFMGCILGFIYCGVVVLLIVVPQIMFPDSQIVPVYQVVVFLLFWWCGLRFAKRTAPSESSRL